MRGLIRFKPFVMPSSESLRQPHKCSWGFEFVCDFRLDSSCQLRASSTNFVLTVYGNCLLEFLRALPLPLHSSSRTLSRMNIMTFRGSIRVGLSLKKFPALAYSSWQIMESLRVLHFFRVQKSFNKSLFIKQESCLQAWRTAHCAKGEHKRSRYAKFGDSFYTAAFHALLYSIF